MLTRSKALVRSIKAIYRDFLSSRHFSCSCLSEKIMSSFDLKFQLCTHTLPHGQSTSINQSTVHPVYSRLELFQHCTGKGLRNATQEGYSAVAVTVSAVSLVLVKLDDVGVAYVPGHCVPSSQHCSKSSSHVDGEGERYLCQTR